MIYILLFFGSFKSRTDLGLSRAREQENRGKKRKTADLNQQLPSPPPKKTRQNIMMVKSGHKRKYDNSEAGGGELILPPRKKTKNDKLKVRSEQRLLNMTTNYKLRVDRALKHRLNERKKLSKFYKAQLANKHPNLERSKKRRFEPELHHIDKDRDIAAKTLKTTSDLPRLPGRLLQEKIICSHCKTSFVTSEAYLNHRRYDNLDKKSISLLTYNKKKDDYVLICPLKTCCFYSHNLSEYFNHVKIHDIHARYLVSVKSVNYILFTSKIFFLLLDNFGCSPRQH